MAGRGAAPSVTALSLPGTSGNYAATPDTAGNSITGDIDIRVKAAATDWTPAGISSFITKWGSSSLSWRFALETSGVLTFNVSSSGANSISASSTVATGFADGTTHWVRATRVGSTMSWYTSMDGSAWTQLGTSVGASSGSIFNGTRPLEIGGFNSGVSQLFTGQIFYAEVRSGAGGTVVAQYDPSAITILGTRNPTTVVAGTGETWTMTGSGWDWATV